MNHYFRLLWHMIRAKFKTPCRFDENVRSQFRVWPSDLDTNRHMNNGVYFSLQDLARLELILRCGFDKALKKRGWYPVISSETLQFRRSLKPFSPFEIETQVAGWDDRYVYLCHRFWQGEILAAEGVVQTRFLKVIGGKVSPEEICDEMSISRQSPSLPDWVLDWANGQAALRLKR